MLQATNAELRLNIAEHRVTQANGIGAKILTSACPACKMALLDDIRSTNAEIEMLDLTELVAQKLDSSKKS